MSSDLEIIIKAAIKPTVFSGNTTEPVVTCNMKSLVLLQNDIDISGCVTSV